MRIKRIIVNNEKFSAYLRGIETSLGSKNSSASAISFQPTYEELKHSINRLILPSHTVFSLPTRN